MGKLTQKNKTYNADRQRHIDNEKEALGGNRRLAQWRVKWLIEHPTSHQLLWYIDSLELRNLHYAYTRPSTHFHN